MNQSTDQETHDFSRGRRSLNCFECKIMRNMRIIEAEAKSIGEDFSDILIQSEKVAKKLWNKKKDGIWDKV